MAIVMVAGLVACTPEADDDTPRASISLPPEVLENKEFVNADIYPLETDTVLRVLFTEDGMGDIDASNLWEEVTGVEVENLTWTNEQLMNCLAAGDIPDAIVMPWDFDKSQVYEYGSAGKFLDFSKHLDKMPNLCALIREYPEILEVCGYPDGAMYSLPKIGWGNTYQSNLLYIRTDMLEEMGWDHAPATTDDFLKFIKEAQAKYGATNPEFIAFCPSSNTYMEWTGMNSMSAAFFPAFGELVETSLTINTDNEIVLGAATEQFRHYLEFMHEIWESGAFETGIYTLEATAAGATVKNGNTAVSMGAHAQANVFSDGVQHVEVMEPLVSRFQSTKQWMKTPEINYRGCVANANCEDLDTLLAWLDSFYAPEGNPLNKEGTVFGTSISKGELGVNWTIDNDSQTWSSGTKFVNYYDHLYTGVSGLYVPTGDLHIKGEGTMENLLPYAVPVSDLQNKVLLSEDEQDEYTSMWSDIDRYISQMHAKFITGEEDIETGWNNYLNQLNKMGLEDVLEIWQNAYDAK